MSTHSQVRVRSSLARSAATLASMALPQHYSMSIRKRYLIPSYVCIEATLARSAATSAFLSLPQPEKNNLFMS